MPKKKTPMEILAKQNYYHGVTRRHSRKVKTEGRKYKGLVWPR